MADVDRIPELLVDKKFHIFVCYSNEDQDVANTVTQNLEDHGVVCSYHGRDFMPGTNIINNICTSVDESMNVLLLLSEHFIASSACGYELDIALHSMMENKTNIIPVMLEPCEIPHSIRHITYIDAQDGNFSQLHVEIIDKMMKKERRRIKEMIPSGRGIPLPFQVSKASHRVNISEHLRATVAAHQIEVSDYWWDVLEKTLNSTTAIRYGHTVNRYRTTAFILSLCFFLVAIILCLTACLFLPTGRHQKMPTGTLFFLILAGVIVIAIVMHAIAFGVYTNQRLVHFYVKAFLHLQSLLWTKVNQHFFWNKYFLFIYHDDLLRVVQYNAEPCVSYLSRRLKDNDKWKDQMLENETPEACVRRLFNRFLEFESHKLVVQNFNKVRHQTANSAPCLCLLVQEWIGDEPPFSY